MSYAAGEALILSKLREMAQFNENNSGLQGEGWRLLATGKSRYYAVLRPGAFTNEYDGVGRTHVTTQWRTVIELWLQWTNTSVTTTDLQNLMDNTIRHLERFPFLDDDETMYAEPSSGGEMQERQRIENGPLWAVWEVYCDWQEERNIDPA